MGSGGAAAAATSVKVKAQFTYKAIREDELSFPKHAIITNVDKQDGGWWKGDYGGKCASWFPTNYVEEIEVADVEIESKSPTFSVLGEMQKGSIDLRSCNFELGDGRSQQAHAFKI